MKLAPDAPISAGIAASAAQACKRTSRPGAICSAPGSDLSPVQRRTKSPRPQRLRRKSLAPWCEAGEPIISASHCRRCCNGRRAIGLWSGDINLDAAVPIITHGRLPGVRGRSFSVLTTCGSSTCSRPPGGLVSITFCGACAESTGGYWSRSGQKWAEGVELSTWLNHVHVEDGDRSTVCSSP